jgi:hypothetical protein
LWAPLIFVSKCSGRFDDAAAARSSIGPYQSVTK